jgi:hypothetical protein
MARQHFIMEFMVKQSHSAYGQDAKEVEKQGLVSQSSLKSHPHNNIKTSH